MQGLCWWKHAAHIQATGQKLVSSDMTSDGLMHMHPVNKAPHGPATETLQAVRRRRHAGLRVYTQEQWEEFDADGTKAMEKELKQVLEGVAQQLFGNVEASPGPVCELCAPCLRQPLRTVEGLPGLASAPVWCSGLLSPSACDQAPIMHDSSRSICIVSGSSSAKLACQQGPA